MQYAGQPIRQGSSSSDGLEGQGGDKKERRAMTQKRYREKQAGKLQQLEQIIQEKTAQLQALSVENAGLKTRERALEKLVACRDEQLVVLGQVRSMCKADAGGGGGGCFGPDCASAVQCDAEELVKFKNMTSEDLRQHWKGFITRASQLITSAPADSHDMLALVSETGRLMKAVIQLNCPAMYALQQVNIETGAVAQAPEGHWVRLTRTLGLSAAQLGDAVAMHQLYQALMEKVYEERRLIKESLSAAASSKAAEVSQAGVPSYLLPPTHCCMEEMECAEKLYLNLHKERSTRCLLCCFFFGRLLTPAQLARLAVTSYPHFPDPLAVTNELSKCSAEPALTR